MAGLILLVLGVGPLLVPWLFVTRNQLVIPSYLVSLIVLYVIPLIGIEIFRVNETSADPSGKAIYSALTHVVMDSLFFAAPLGVVSTAIAYFVSKKIRNRKSREAV